MYTQTHEFTGRGGHHQVILGCSAVCFILIFYHDVAYEGLHLFHLLDELDSVLLCCRW